MEYGKLNKRVSIQSFVLDSPPADSFGEPQGTWTEIYSVWASVEPLSGREFFAQQQIQAEVTTRFRIRYISGILPNMRVVYNSLIYDIKSVIDFEERHEYLQLMCSEGVSDG